jgi:succinate dehydrogenase/fumarate reductase cytochrome b subunit
MQLGSGMRLWVPPVIGAIIYPALISFFQWAVRGYRESDSLLVATLALLLMLLAMSVPALAMTGLIRMRHHDGPALPRVVLYLAFAVPSLFSLTWSLTGTAGVRQYLPVIWPALWIAAGLALYLRERSVRPIRPRAGTGVARLRVTHGAAALVLLLAFLIAHVVNHDLALWSESLHGDVMNCLRQWYRSAWVEPVILALLLVMIVTGVPMVVHHSRSRMDAFRVVQAASGVYVGVFLCSHMRAVLTARELGIETDWTFASGPDSLLDGIGMSGRLIPHYFLGTLCLVVHVACGLRVVLLQHGIAKVTGNRVFYGLSAVAIVVTAASLAALLGFHFVEQ